MKIYPGLSIPEAAHEHSKRDGSFANGIKLRIMPLGASITHGYLSTDGNGYRDVLRTSIVDGGNDVDMVGNNPEGEMEDNDNEGWPGYILDQVRDKAKTSAPQHRPNVYLINAGTNDCVRSIDIDHAGDRVEDLVNLLYDTGAEATVLLSTLLVNGNDTAEANVLEINKQIKQLVSDHQDAGHPIVLVDFHGDDGLTLDDIRDDGTHPTDEGYAKMAPFWINGLREADSKGFLQEAVDV